MEITSVKNGNRVLKLPPGFRFHPTDEELLLHYLKRKVHSAPLPSNIVPDFDVCNSDPWDLPGTGNGYTGKERYFFSGREAKYPNGNRSNRATPSGYWKSTGKDKPIAGIGMKKTLVFYKGKPPHGQRTNWVMHEYRLISNLPHQAKGNWVLCRIVPKNRNNAETKKDAEDKEDQKMASDADDDENKKDSGTTKVNNVVLYDLNLPPPPSLSSSSSSSGASAITQISPNNDDSESSTSVSREPSFSPQN